MKVIIGEYMTWDTVVRVGNHHYARTFMHEGWDVCWVSHPVSPLHGLKRANRERMRRAGSGPYGHPDGPVEIVPFTFLPVLNLPVLDSAWAIATSYKLSRPSFRKLLKSAGFDEVDLVWVTDPVLWFLAEVPSFTKLAVRIADDNTQFRNMPGCVRWAEDTLCERADVVFATSSPLAGRLRERFGSKVCLLRNGVQFSHFQGDFERPPEYENIRAPIAVYVGAIEDWFAVDWVEALAVSRPDITVVLIGRQNINLSALDPLKNVLKLGPRPYARLPQYLAHADCGIIPFKRTALVESVSPLKLFEYFAAGLPAVATQTMELRSLDSPALLVPDARAFADAVGTAVDRQLKQKEGEKFRLYAKENSWESRFENAMRALGFSTVEKSS